MTGTFCHTSQVKSDYGWGKETANHHPALDMDALHGIPGAIHETEGGHVLDVERIRLLACDSSISRIVWNGRSEILDVGRRTRVIPAALRRAVIARDRHCRGEDALGRLAGPTSIT